MFCQQQWDGKLGVFFSAKKAQDVCRGEVGAPPPKNVERVISEYVDCKKVTIFFN
jgi:hypothetical protein